jgi:hypothetical protein
MRKLPLILALGALIAFPQYASAQTNSGIDQYEENIPAPGGDSPTGGGGTGSGGGGGGSGSESADPGSAGSGSAPAPAETAPAPADTADAGKAQESGAGRVDVAKSDASGSRQNKDRQNRDKAKNDEDLASVGAQGSGPADSVSTVEDTSGDGGIGIVLPIILGASALAALIVLMARRRRGSAHAPPA